ncbi:TRAP transporter small permease [Salinarimonas soli]|uniref:TRAP transporter small permease protein n=1 Tax=Salinarimonas soli TaxID=1638099 RepID=A0A5B2V8I7_9HYPH|nr:TRAP transporter small permease subunit [Salinarimonas soli]KAA2235803.1 TRAP transporter small permease subunit [Salinarimonas soli]
MRAVLDRLYAASLWLSALCILAIAVLVGLQVGGRILDALLKLVGARETGFVILSLSEFAGYLLAAASFLALAGTLKGGVHIRVTMILGMLPESVRRMVEVAGLAFAVVVSAYGTWYLGRLAYDSWRFNELSSGLVPVPLVYPQAAMALGAALLVVAFLDECLITLRRGRPSFRATEDAITLGQEG